MHFTHKPSMAEKIASAFDSITQRVNDSVLKVNPRSFIDILTAEDEDTLVMRDGTLLTAIKVHGSTRDILVNEYIENIDSLESSFRSYFTSNEHYFSFTFKSDNENIDNTINQMYTKQALEVAQRLELDLEDIIKEMHSVYADTCQDESVYLLVWTNVNNLTKPERKQLMKERTAYKTAVPRHNEAQPAQYTARGFFEKHKAMCKQIISDLLGIHIHASISTNLDFLKELRINIDEAFTDGDWTARLPGMGEDISLRVIADNNADLSGMFHAPISEQLIPREMLHEKEGVCRSGDILFAPLSLEYHPKEPQPFDLLFLNLSKMKIPFRMHMLIRNDGMSIFGMKTMLARVLSFTGSEENKQLLECYNNLKKLRRNGEEIVSSQITFCTWSRDVDDLTEVRMRKNSLAKAISGWGSCQVSQAEGDEVESTLSSIGGVTMGSVSPMAAAPLYDALKMAPIARVGSAWERGTKLYKSQTGKLLPYMPYSKQQLAWVKFVVGPMGSGKTVHLNGEHFSLLLHPDNDELPFILNVDIGPGMKGFCDLVRDALPASKKHQVVYEKLLNRKDKAINVFDTPLGLRRPLSNQKAFLETIIGMLCTRDDVGTAPDGVSAILSKVIDLTYNYRATRQMSKVYAPNVSTHVDELLALYDINSANENGRELKWWDVVDFLASKGENHAAIVAQRFAVPTLEDLAAKVMDSRITSTYEGTMVQSTGENICKYIQRKLNGAINTYPVLSGYTQFDIGDSRIVSLDLDEVAKGVGGSASSRLSLMYFLAYFTLTKRIFTGEEHLGEMQNDSAGLFPFDYLPYHGKYISAIEKLPKRFSGDEIHRFKNDPIAKALQEISIREGRKWKVDIMQASQLPEDFNPEMIKLATDIVILGRGNRSNVESITKYFKLPSNLSLRLGSNSMRKPSKAGATIVMMVETAKARYEQFVISMYGSSFLWATTSNRDDTIVKSKLTKALGTSKARKLLVELYPAGSLDDEIDERRRADAVSLVNINDNISLMDQSEEAPAYILNDIFEDAMRHYDKKISLQT
jgi:intracellular multiplication protein IcmB